MVQQPLYLENKGEKMDLSLIINEVMKLRQSYETSFIDKQHNVISVAYQEGSLDTIDKVLKLLKEQNQQELSITNISITC